MLDEKQVFQDWLSSISFSHFITVEPNFTAQFSNDEILQRFRSLEFRLNKHFLKSSFPKWDPFDRFFMVAFAEGDGVTHRKHFHLLLHSPENANLQQKQFRKGSVSEFLYFEWFRDPSLIYSFQRRHVEPLHIKALSPTYDNHSSSKAASIYTSKTLSNRRKWSLKDENISWWGFTTPSNDKPLAKALLQLQLA